MLSFSPKSPNKIFLVLTTLNGDVGMSSLQLGYTILDRNYVKSTTLFTEHKTVEDFGRRRLAEGKD